MDFWHGFWLITGIHILAAMSPGPDFIFVSQQTISQGRRIGLISSLGVALGLGIHMLYSVLGLAVVIASSTWLLMLIKVAGGIYLIWLGIQGLRARAPQQVGGKVVRQLHHTTNPHATRLWRALRRGFFCNVLNPKAPVYFVAVFTVVLSPQMPLWQLAIYGAWMMVLQFAWFAIVACVLSIPRIHQQFQQVSHWIDRVLGAVLVVLGIRVVSS